MQLPKYVAELMLAVLYPVVFILGSFELMPRYSSPAEELWIFHNVMLVGIVLGLIVGTCVPHSQIKYGIGFGSFFSLLCVLFAGWLEYNNLMRLVFCCVTLCVVCGVVVMSNRSKPTNTKSTSAPEYRFMTNIQKSAC